MFRKTVYGNTFKDVNFVPLQSATFCIQCELISANSKPYCLACGSQSLLGLSRVLGGSLLHEQTAHLILDAELNSLVRDLLRTVPHAEVLNIADHRVNEHRSPAYTAERAYADHSYVAQPFTDQPPPGQPRIPRSPSAANCASPTPPTPYPVSALY